MTKRYCYFVKAWNTSQSVEAFNKKKNPYTIQYSGLLRAKLKRIGIPLKRLPSRQGAGFCVETVRNAALAAMSK